MQLILQQCCIQQHVAATVLGFESLKNNCMPSSLLSVGRRGIFTLQQYTVTLSIAAVKQCL